MLVFFSRGNPPYIFCKIVFASLSLCVALFVHLERIITNLEKLELVQSTSLVNTQRAFRIVFGKKGKEVCKNRFYVSKFFLLNDLVTDSNIAQMFSLDISVV